MINLRLAQNCNSQTDIPNGKVLDYFLFFIQRKVNRNQLRIRKGM